MLLTGGGRARKECKELERHKVLTRKNEMTLDKGKLLRQLFEIEYEEEEDREQRVVHPKTDEQRCRQQEVCKDILLFRILDQEQQSQVLDAMFERKVKPQEHVIDQDDDGDNFYVIERGLYDIVVAKDNHSHCVGCCGNHSSFGELDVQ
ncbi:hypothetical protein Q9966_001080 [Columba livia]|nr:hypothetical protein Q9966_001080 [Columba livia]